MYRGTRFYYLDFKQFLYRNTYFCFQNFRATCLENFSDNVIGKIYLQDDETLDILDDSKDIYTTKNVRSCSSFQNNSFVGTIDAKTKQFPVKQICGRKIDENNANAYVRAGVDNLMCFSKLNYLTSNQNAIIDNNPETCSYDRGIKKVYFNKVPYSSMNVEMLIKTDLGESICNYTLVLKHDTNSCGNNAVKECNFIESKISFHLSRVSCLYFCEIGYIGEIRIKEKITDFSFNSEICEVSTYLPDTSNEKNYND